MTVREYGYDSTFVEVGNGYCIMIYGPFGCGKTHSLGTLYGPIAVVVTEPRDPRPILSWTKEPITFFEVGNFDDVKELFFNWEMEAREGKFQFKSIALDSASFIQSEFKSTLQDDRYKYRIDTDKAREGLIDRFRLDEADWGPVAEIMKRITAAANRLSKYGVTVVFTAYSTESPSWNRALEAAPFFQGREYPKVLNGYFDFIGFIVDPWKIQKNGSIRPPVISFKSEDESYVAKCCSIPLAKRSVEFPDARKYSGASLLDFKKILEIIKSKETKNGG